MATNTPNQQWKYVIISIDGDEPRGTDELKVALEFSKSDECYVLEMATCKTMTTNIPNDGEDAVTEYDSIPEQKVYEFNKLGGIELDD